MYSKKYALYGSALMLIIGVFSILPGLEGNLSELPPLKVNLSYGAFLGIFPLNIFNKVALILFGLAGIYCARQSDRIFSVRYCEIVAVAMGALAVLGLIPQTATLGGIWPLFGGEVYSHGLFAIVAGLCAYADLHAHDNDKFAKPV